MHKDQLTDLSAGKGTIRIEALERVVNIALFRTRIDMERVISDIQSRPSGRINNISARRLKEMAEQFDVVNEVANFLDEIRTREELVVLRPPVKEVKI